MENKKQIDYASIDYGQFKKAIRKALYELESATGTADETAVAKLQQQKADIDKQIAALGVKKAAIMKQIDAIEKK